jgi:hypothetical protein
MTFQQFLEKYSGHYIDFDGAWGNQCFDLFHQYVVEVLKLSDGRIMAAPAAKDLYNNFSNLYGHDYFEKIENTPTDVPKEGDIVIFGSGQYGHVCIFIEGNVSRFSSFDQNYPTGSPCHVQQHTYGYCLGWLRFKGAPPSDQILSQSDAFIAVCSKLGIAANKDIVLTEIDKLLTYEDIIRQRETELNEAKDKVSILLVQTDGLKTQLRGLTDDNYKLAEQIADQEKTINITSQQVASLSSELQKLREANNPPVLTGLKKILYDLLVKW